MAATKKKPPAGWRKEWTRKADRRAAKRGKRQDARVRLPLPEPPELRRRALWVLLDIAEDRESHDASRVGAAKALVTETRPTPRELVLELLDGDRGRFEAWLRAEIAEIETRRPVNGQHESSESAPAAR